VRHEPGAVDFRKCGSAQKGAGFALTFAPMMKKLKKPATKPAMADLRGAYARATLAFNEASADLILKFAANRRPADEQIAVEEKLRAAVVTARQNLWAAYAKT
jgi:hypothetical protein